MRGNPAKNLGKKNETSDRGKKGKPPKAMNLKKVHERKRRQDQCTKGKKKPPTKNPLWAGKREEKKMDYQRKGPEHHSTKWDGKPRNLTTSPTQTRQKKSRNSNTT